MIAHNFFRERTSDYWEMNVHHFLTLSLLSGMIMQNFIRAGVLISYLHNVSDIFTASCRVLSHTVLRNFAIALFVFTIFDWMYFRNFCIPYACYNLWVHLRYPKDLDEY